MADEDSPSILVVDDDEASREAMRAQLSLHHYRIITAANANEAFETLEREPLDVVICDVLMPGTDGFEVCRRLKSHPQWSLIPVMLATALNSREDLLSGLDAGADEFISKPVDYEVLLSRLRVLTRIRSNYSSLLQSDVNFECVFRDRVARFARAGNLTAREIEVLDLLLLGRSHADIATVLSISPRTAKFHQGNVLRKLGADSRSDLLRILL